jgi:HEAT repeat protein
LQENPAFCKTPGLTQSLVRALHDKRPDVRSYVAQALGQCQDPQAFEPLMKMLNDPDGHVRADAALALGEQGDPRARRALEGVAKNATHMVYMYGLEGSAAMRALGQLGSDKGTLLFLLGRARSRYPDVPIRCGAIRGLGTLGDEGAVEELTRIVSARFDEPFEVRAAAIRAISQIQKRKAIPVLTKHALDKNEWRCVRFSAAESLVRVTDGQVDDFGILDVVREGPGGEDDYPDILPVLQQIVQHGKTKEIRAAADKIRKEMIAESED